MSDWFNRSWENLFSGQAKIMAVVISLEERLQQVEAVARGAAHAQAGADGA